MSKRPPGSYFRNKKKQKEAEAKEPATQWEKSKSKWFNVKNEQKINTLKDGASEIQKINESIKIKIDSGCSQIEQTSNINELSFQEIPLEIDENILVDHDLSNGITEKTEKQSLVDEEINVLQPPEIIFNNPQSWPTITDKLRCILVQNGPNRGKLDYKPFKNHWFYKKLPNGESVERSWMMYSQPNDAIFCFCCMLFGKQFTALSDPKRGFLYWKKMERLKEHEDSQDHVKHFLEWKMLENKLLKGGGIDDSLQKEIQSEQEKWRHVLKIILDVLLYCANNNLALRGNSEDIGNPAAGHFLNLISSISKSDGVLRQHIESHKKGSVSYFSHHIQDEFISLLSKKVREKIINQIKSSS